jgi:hypothetical protein
MNEGWLSKVEWNYYAQDGSVSSSTTTSFSEAVCPVRVLAPAKKHDCSI